MEAKQAFTPEQLHYLHLLAKQYPTVQSAGTEIIKLKSVLNLPKGTEHFLSDIHQKFQQWFSRQSLSRKQYILIIYRDHLLL